MKEDGEGNRAVSALFRCWGGADRLPSAEASRPSGGHGLHRGEAIVLGSLVPLVAAAAVVERLVSWCGPAVAAALALPASFVALHLAAFLLGPPARACARWCGSLEGWRWRWWAAALGGWSWWAAGRGGWPAVFGWLWLGLLGANALGLAVLGWRALMRVRGWPGIWLRVLLAVAWHLPMLWLGLAFGLRSAIGWGALVAALWCRGTLSAKAGWFGPVVNRLPGRGVWLTIDDGPDPATTPALLELLDRHGAKATFFAIGRKVEEHPELARRIVARGHALGNHTGSHPAGSFWCAGPWRTRREIERGSRAIEQATGAAPVWFRAPVGHRNYFTHPFAAAGGMRVAGWSRRGFDGVSTDSRAILRRLLEGVADGEVVVVHDARPRSAEVLGGLLEGLAKRGIRVRQPEG